MKHYYVHDKRGELVEVEQSIARELVHSGKRNVEDFTVEEDGSEPAAEAPKPTLPRVQGPFSGYADKVNAASSVPQAIMPGGQLVQAPAVGVFPDPVSLTSQGAFAPIATVSRLPAAPVAPARPSNAPAPKSATSPILREELARRASMAATGLTPGQRRAKEERDQVAQHEAEYQQYLALFHAAQQAEGGVRTSDGSLSTGEMPMDREGFALAKAGYAQPGAWMPDEMRKNATRERSAMQAIGAVTDDASRALARPMISAIDAVAGVAPGYDDLSHASNKRRSFEAQARVQDLRKQAEASAMTPGEEAYLDENDPGIVSGTVQAVKGIPGMVGELLENPESRRQSAVDMATGLVPSLAISAGAGAALDALKAGKYAWKLRNVRKGFEGRAASGAMSAEKAAAGTARWMQMEDGRKAIAELYDAVKLHPNLARELASETLGDGLADAFVETLNSYGRGENTGFVQNFFSGLPLDLTPYLAINAGKLGVKRIMEGPNNGLSRKDFDAAMNAVELSPTIADQKTGMQVIPTGHQKAGTTATRPQVEAMMHRPDLKDRMRQVADLARNPETSGTSYRLGSEDARVDMGAEELQAASYGGREGTQVVNGYNQPRKGYEYVQGEDGSFRSVQVDRPVAHITGNGGASTVAHETIHSIEDRLRRAAYADASGATPEAKLVDIMDDWTERAYQWGKDNGVFLPGKKELLTQAMTYRLGWGDDFDPVIRDLPVPDELVRAFAARAGKPLRGGDGLRAYGTKMDDMREPESVAPEQSHEVPEEIRALAESTSNDEMPFSFAGKNAKGADLDKMAEAERRLEAGEDRDAVRRSTGWHKGADGKMRFEVDDSGAKIKNMSFFMGEGEASGKLSKVLDHPELFRAYPELADVDAQIFVAPNMEVSRGSFSPSENRLRVSARSKEEALSSLLHEVQHSMQRKEGFAKGGSPDAFSPLNVSETRISEINRELNNLLNGNPEFGSLKRKQNREFIRLSDAYGETGSRGRKKLDWDKVPDSERDAYFDLLDQVESYPEAETYFDLEQERRRHTQDPVFQSPFEQYQRLSGETEARNTQTRRDFTADQRRERAPWETQDVADNEQIVRFSLASEAGIPEGRKDDPKVVDAARKAWKEKGVESPWFKRWFGDSKVVDKNGKPLVVYHGTSGDEVETSFTEFDDSRIGVNSDESGSGFHFTSDLDVAHGYAFNGFPSNGELKTENGSSAESIPEGEFYSWVGADDRWGGKGAIGEFYLDIKNPLILDANDYAQNFHKTNEIAKEIRETGEYDGVEYDGVIIRNARWDRGNRPRNDQYIVFSPEQIKSATGNRGTFDAADADIRFSLAKDDPRQKILSHMSKVLRGLGIVKSQNDLSTEWGAIPDKAKADPELRKTWEQKWKTAEEALRQYVMDNPTIAAEAGLKPIAVGHADDFDVQEAIWKFRDWTNSSTDGKLSGEELDHIAQAKDAAMNGAKAAGVDEHPMSKRSLLWMARSKDHKAAGAVVFDSLGERFKAKWDGKQGVWVVKSSRGGDAFTLPREGSVWIDGEAAKAPVYAGPGGPVDPRAGQKASQGDFNEGALSKGEDPETWWQKQLRHYTDAMLDMKKMQKRLKNKDANPYREYDLINGRTDHGIKKTQRRFIDPMLKIMDKHGITQDDVDDYLYARHAKRVNEYVRTIREDNDAGSGMSDAEADAIMAKVNSDAVNRKAYEAIGELSNRMNRWRMDLEVKSGLRSEADALKMAKQYPDYVPLRGLPDAGADLLPDWMLTTDREHDSRPDVVRGKTAKADNKKRIGRKSRAESVLAQNLQRTIDTIVNAQRNLAARELLKAAAANPDELYWEINPTKTKEVLETVVDENGDKSKKVTSKYDPRMSRVDKGIIPVWVDGQAHYLEMKTDEGVRFAEAIKGLGAESMGPILRKVNSVMRFWKAALTSKNPMFTTKNFIRDTLMSAMVSYSRDGSKVFRDTLRGVPGAARAVWMHEAGHKSGWDHYIDLWSKEGGQIGFTQAEGFDRLADKIDADLKDLGRSAYDPRKAFKRFVEGTELINSGIEAANRLAYFRALIDSGVDAKTAASKSKELTVNFNRRGNATLANTYKLFLNANLQGKMNLWDVATNPESRGRFWKVVAPTMATLGASSAALGMWLGGDDEDSGRSMYDRLRPYEKSNRIVIMDPRGTGKYITLPLPYDIALPYQIGRLAFEAAMKEGSDPTATRAQLAKDATLEIANVMMESFNPSASRIDPGDWAGSAVSVAMPSFVGPALEVYANKNYAGRPIYPENRANGVEKPESDLHYPGVNPVFRGMADALARATGKGSKNEFTPGLVEISPEKIEHLFNAYGGGMAKLFQQGVGLFGAMSEKGLEGVEARQIPFWSDYGHAPGDRLDRQDFDEFLKGDKAAATSFLNKARDPDASSEERRKLLEENYASIISAKAFGGLRSKEFKLQGVEDLVEDMDFGDGVKGEFKGFYAKAWKARKKMEALQEAHNDSTDPEERKRLRKQMEDELKRAFEGFGK